MDGLLHKGALGEAIVKEKHATVKKFLPVSISAPTLAPMIIATRIRDDGTQECQLVMQDGDCPQRVAIQLASTTRMIARALADALKLPKDEEQIEAAIVHHFNVDIHEFGSLGEVVKCVKTEPKPEEDA